MRTTTLRTRWLRGLGAGAATATLIAGVTGGAAAQDQSGSLTIWMLGFDPHIKGWTAVADAYKAKNPNVTINIEPQADFTAAYTAALESDSGADIFTVPGWDLYKYALAGDLAPLTPCLMTYEEAKAALTPEYLLQAPIGDTVWGVGIPDPPGDAGIISNVDLLAAAGLEAPASFESRDQLLEYAKAATKTDGDIITQSGLSFVESNDYAYFWSYIIDQGATFWDNETQRFNYQTDEARAALQWFVDLYQVHKTDSSLNPNSFDQLFSGTGAMAFMWPEFMPFAEGAAPDLNLSFSMKPSWDGASPPVFGHGDTWNAAIPAYSANSELACDLLRFYLTDEGQMAFLEQNPGLSPLRAITFGDTEYYKTGKGAYLAPVIEAFKAGQFRFYGPFPDGQALVVDLTWPIIEKALRGELSVDEALVQMEEASNAHMDTARAQYPDAPQTIIYDVLPDDLAIK